jgi:2-keto-4-pentenoate hydratase/2-oxohepta-3-ene-1,7-dioic acid hydratase in catechol pathway
VKLVSVVTSDGQRIAVTTGDGIFLAEQLCAAQDLDKATWPHSIDEYVYGCRQFASGIEAIRNSLGSAAPFAQDEGKVRIGRLFQPRNVICVGLNYRDHALECGRPIPKQPILFAKWTGSVVGPGEPVILPPDTEEVDYEAELAVIIGRECRGVTESEALNYVAGYTCMNDVSARDFQRADGQWVRAKSQDTFGPMGPCLVTPDEIPEPQALDIRCLLNGTVVQNSNTREMIFGVRELIAYISRGITLLPGDVICTGTPSGIGQAQKPQRFLRPGDEVSVDIECVGRLTNYVRGKATG